MGNFRRGLCFLFLAGLATDGYSQTELSEIQVCQPDQLVNTDSELSKLKRVELDARRIIKDAMAGGSQLTGEEFVSQLQTLFGVVDATPEGRLAAAALLRAVAEELDTTQSALNGVRRQIFRRVELVEAGLNSIAASVSDPEAVQSATGVFDEFAVRTAVDFEFAGREVHGKVVFENLQRLQEQYPAVYAAVEPVFRRHFLNFNLRLVISEPAACVIVNKPETRSEGVSDCVLGASVSGHQSTVVLPEADILPSASSAMWKVTGRGTTEADTRSSKGPATICTKGNHCFTADRIMTFAGLVAFGKPNICVDANNTNVGLSTRFDRTPILRGLVRRIAWNQAQKLRPRTEAIAAQKIADQALPTFDESSSSNFRDLNSLLAAWGRFRQNYVGLAPEYEAYSSDTHLFVGSKTRAPMNLAGSAPLIEPLPQTTVVLQLHESALNAMIDGVGVLLEEQLNELLQTVVKEHLKAKQLSELDIQTLGRDVQNLVQDLKAKLARRAENMDVRRLKEALPFVSDEGLAAMKDYLPELIDVYLSRLAPAALFEALKNGERGKVDVFLLMDVINRILQGELPRIRLRDCDPVRIRIDEGEAVIVLGAGPRKNGRSGKEVPFALAIDDGRFSVVAAKPTPKVDVLESLIDAHRAKPGEDGDTDDVLRDTIREKIEKGLAAIDPDLVFNTPDHLSTRVERLSLSDGWITVELSLGNVISVSAAP